MVPPSSLAPAVSKMLAGALKIACGSGAVSATIGTPGAAYS